MFLVPIAFRLRKARNWGREWRTSWECYTSTLSRLSPQRFDGEKAQLWFKKQFKNRSQIFRGTLGLANQGKWQLHLSHLRTESTYPLNTVGAHEGRNESWFRAMISTEMLQNPLGRGLALCSFQVLYFPSREISRGFKCGAWKISHNVSVTVPRTKSGVDQVRRRVDSDQLHYGNRDDVHLRAVGS